jgi:alpha-N-arabinofuranosidase
VTQHIVIDTSSQAGTISPETYGHFIEHLGRCIYDGIWVGEDSSIPNVEGFRQEAVDVFRAVNAPLIRWPGGYFADCYNWRDGIGHRETRPCRFHNFEPAFQEPNQMGTHEFLRFCELVGAAPNICVNTATLGPQEAMDWVEYCNHDGASSMASLRRQNGRAKPWGVKYWAIGNECYYMHRSQAYVDRYLLWRAHMRRVDESIQCIASLMEPCCRTFMARTSDWLPEVISGIHEHMELASLHVYTLAGPGEGFDADQYWNALVQIDHKNRHRIEAFLGAIDAVVGRPKIKLALDEWGLWHTRATMSNNCEQPCTQRDAIFAARYFHMLHGLADRIGLATVAQGVNVLQAMLRTDGPRSYRTPTFHVFEMFKAHQGGKVLSALVSSGRKEIPPSLKEHRFFDRGELSVVTASATLSPDGQSILLSATNADLEKSFDYEVRFVGELKPRGTINCRILADDPHAQNSYDQPDRVQPRQAKASLDKAGTVKVTLPPCSIATLSINVSAGERPRAS